MVGLPPSPTQSNILAALRSFLLGILPNGNAKFTGSIAGNTLTVTTMTAGAISFGDAILGEGVYPGTMVTAFGTGTGGTGTCTLNTTQTVAAGTKMYTGVEVVQAQTNRVPEPAVPDFVTMTPIMQSRLETNVDSYRDVSFTASIAGNTMTVTAVAFGSLAVGQTVFGVNVADGTKIIALGSGIGGVGTYTVSQAQTVASEKMASGAKIFLQPTKIMVQLDVHGPNSADNSQTISTLFRDDFAVQAFKASGFDVTPLFASDPRQLPYVNENQQTENRWVIDVHMQANPTIRAPQEFADQLDITLIDVDAAYPAT